MVVSYKIEQTKVNEVARSKESGSKTNTAPKNLSPTPRAINLQMYSTFHGNENGIELYNDLFHLNRLSADD
jgi:hypothetical protein